MAFLFFVSIPDLQDKQTLLYGQEGEKDKTPHTNRRATGTQSSRTPPFKIFRIELRF